jgi:tetratricopeptide (TPR) repeat protein
MNFLLGTFANQLPRKAGGDTLTVFDLMARMEKQLQDDQTFFRENLSRVYNLMADINYRYKNFEKSSEYYYNALKYHAEDPYDAYFSARHKYISFIGLGRHYYGTQQRDSSIHYYARAIEFARQQDLNPIEAYTGLGKLELLANNYEVADSIFKRGMFYANKPDIPSQESKAFFLGVYGNFLGRYFPHENKEKIDSLFKAAIKIYNQPVRYNSNMAFNRKSEGLQFFKRKDTLLGPPLKIQHPTSFAEVINYYGIYNYNMEQFDTALHQFEIAYQLNAKYYGKNSIVALENANNIAIIHKEKGDLNKALDTFKELWQASKDNETIPQAFSINFYHNYVVTLYLNGEYKQSIKAFDTLLVLKKKHTPDDHFGFNHAYRHIGQNLYKLGKPREALEYLQMVVDRHSEHAGDKGFQDVNALLQMIVVHGELGNREQVDELYQQNLSIIKRRFGGNSSYIHRNYIAKASALLKLDKPADVIALLKPALSDSIDSHNKNYLHFLFAKGHYLQGNKPVADSIFYMLQQKPVLEPKVKNALVAFRNDLPE